MKNEKQFRINIKAIEKMSKLIFRKHFKEFNSANEQKQKYPYIYYTF